MRATTMTVKQCKINLNFHLAHDPHTNEVRSGGRWKVEGRRGTPVPEMG